MIFQKKYGVLIVIFFALASCTLLPSVQDESDKTYELNTLPLTALKKSTHPKILLVTQPQESPMNGTTRMVYTKTPYQVAYFTNNRWVEKPTSMLRKLIIQSLQNTGYFQAVISPMVAGHADLMLNTQLLELRQDFSKYPSQVRLVMAAQLIEMMDNTIIAAREFSVNEIAPQESPYGGVVAANRAVAEMLKQLVSFCTEG